MTTQRSNSNSSQSSSSLSEQGRDSLQPARWWGNLCALGWCATWLSLGAIKFNLIEIPRAYWLIAHLYFGVLVLLPLLNSDYLKMVGREGWDEKLKLRLKLAVYGFAWAGILANSTILHYFR